MEQGSRCRQVYGVERHMKLNAIWAAEFPSQLLHSRAAHHDPIASQLDHPPLTLYYLRGCLCKCDFTPVGLQNPAAQCPNSHLPHPSLSAEAKIGA